MVENSISLEGQMPELISEGWVSNWMPFVARDTVEGFEIACRDTPLKEIRATTAIIAAFFVVFFAVLWKVGDQPASSLAVVGVGIPTVLGFHFGTIAMHRSQQHRGPLLKFNRSLSLFEFSRERNVLNRDRIAFFAVVQAGRPDGCVLQLQAWLHDGKRLLVLSDDIRQRIKPIALKIQSEAAVPIRIFAQRSARKWEEEAFGVEWK